MMLYGKKYFRCYNKNIRTLKTWGCKGFRQGDCICRVACRRVVLRYQRYKKINANNVVDATDAFAARAARKAA